MGFVVGLVGRLGGGATPPAALCQVAAARFDAMVSLRRVRAVDAAAGQLIAREACGVVCFPGYASPLCFALYAVPRAPVIAARTGETLHELEGITR